MNQKLKPNKASGYPVFADYRERVCLLHKILRERGQALATAESCTSGLLAAVLTETPGSSRTYLGGVNCYSNESKVNLLGVPHADLVKHGAVSEGIAQALAIGVLSRFGAHWGIGITGIAGPDGGSDEKPVGTVWIGSAARQPAATVAQRYLFTGDRRHVRNAAVAAAIDQVLAMLD